MDLELGGECFLAVDCYGLRETTGINVIYFATLLKSTACGNEERENADENDNDKEPITHITTLLSLKNKRILLMLSLLNYNIFYIKLQ